MSEAEINVLALACQGLSTKHISRELAISPRTVDKHRQRMLRKTQTSSIRALTAWVARQYAICGIAAAGPPL
nr:helix-turn-helix transcriptional regulator [Massilia sp. CCM 8734]